MIPDVAHSRPATLEDALRCLADGGAAYVGGTELIAAMHMGLLAPPHLVDLKRIAELRGVRTTSTHLTIGTATRHREVSASPDVRRHAPMLAKACSLLGNVRVRATGSIGGNICFADPRSDVNTALFALQAEVTLRSTEGQRRLPIDEFVLSAMETDRADDELLDAIHVPIADERMVYVRHQPAEYPTVCIGVLISRADPRGAARIVVGAVGERPQVFSTPSLDDIDLDAILPDLDVMEDLNGSDEYKRHLAGVFIGRAVAQLKETLDA